MRQCVGRCLVAGWAACVLSGALAGAGVYELRVAPDERPGPCELHIILRFDNGTEDLEDWVDDWMYDC